MKMCSKCKTIKPLTEFNQRSSSKDGFRNQCAECVKENQRNAYLKNKEKYKERAAEHRNSKPGYRVWEGMIRRCYSEAHSAYKNYGGRGIFVCDEWKNSYEVFYSWLNQNGWKKGLQIDRIDNNSGYFPENCRIVSPMENSNNRRTNRTLTVDGCTLTISEASRKYGIGKTTIKERLNRGWSDLQSISPVRAKA